MNGDYGLWTLVILNSAIFIFFAFSFAKPQTKTDWRALGAFSAFIVALFLHFVLCLECFASSAKK